MQYGGNAGPVGGAYHNWGGKSQNNIVEPENGNGVQQDAAGISLNNWFTVISGEWNDINMINQLYYVIEFDNPPTADFSADQTLICAGDSVSFSDLSLNMPTTWVWTFDGGTPSSSTSQNPIVRYNTPGIYDVKLFVSNNAASDSLIMTEYIAVNQLPVADAGIDSAICKGLSITLSASGGGSYRWSPTTGLDDPDIANPVVTPLATTTFVVTVIDGNACSNTDSIIITVSQDASVVCFDSVICVGDSVSLIASGGINYSWSPSVSLDNSNIANPVATPITTTVYVVTVTDRNNCSDLDSLSITVNPFTHSRCWYGYRYL